MSMIELYTLIMLIVKYRAHFGASHAKRDLMDEMILDILKQLKPLIFEPTPLDELLPF